MLNPSIPVPDVAISSRTASALPASVIANFDTLVAVAPIQSDKTSGVYEAGQRAREAIQDTKAQRAHLHESARNEGELPDPVQDARFAQVIAAHEAAYSAATAEHDALRAISGGTRANVEPTSMLVQRLARQNAEVEVADDVDYRDLPDEQLDAAWQRERDVVQADINEKTRDVKRALSAQGDVAARAHAEINILAERGRPQVLASGGLKWPTTPELMASATGGGAAIVHTFDAQAVVAALLQPQLHELIDRDIDKMYAGISQDEQLSDAQRKQKLAELDELRLESELRECAAIFELWRRGRLDVGLRSGTRPEAILGIRRWTPGPKRTDNRLTVVDIL